VVTLRKTLILAIAAILAIGIFLMAAFLGHIPLGEPRLRIEFCDHPLGR